jgi:ParB family chromosome partitioning protein
LATPPVVNAVIRKVNQKRISNSKDLRKLRIVLRDPVARDYFLSDEGDIESALLRAAPPQPKESEGLSHDWDAAIQAMKRIPWTALSELKGDSEILQKIADAEALLKSLRKTLS